MALARAALLSVAGAPDHQPPYPTRILLFRDDGALLAYHRQADGAPPSTPLMTALDRQGRVLALSLQDAEPALAAARAILAGDLIDQLLVNPPAWLRTGLVGLVARLEPTADRADGPPRLVERVSASATSTGTWPPAQAMRSARPGEYPEAAIGLLRHLAHPSSERSAQLRRYLTLLRGGLPAGAAIEECFFTSFDTLYADVALVAARGGSPPITLEPLPREALPASESPHDEVVLALGDLVLRATPWNTLAADLHFQSILDRHPVDAAALRSVALARDLDGRHDDAIELFERSVAAAPDDRVTLILYGWSRLERFRAVVGTRRGWEEPLPDEIAAARDLFTRALAPTTGGARDAAAGQKAVAEAAPPTSRLETPPHAAHDHDVGPPIAPDASPHALHGFGATYLYARDGFEPGIAALERAGRLLPANDEIAADFVLLHGHAGNHNLAWEVRRERLLDRTAPELDALIERLLVEEILNAADRLLLVQQKPDAAITLVRGARDEVRDPSIRRELDRMLGQMEQVAAELLRDAVFERFLVAYEEAKRLATERRFDEARALLAPFAAEEMDPVVRSPAREALAKLDEVDPP